MGARGVKRSPVLKHKISKRQLHAPNLSENAVARSHKFSTVTDSATRYATCRGSGPSVGGVPIVCNPSSRLSRLHPRGRDGRRFPGGHRGYTDDRGAVVARAADRVRSSWPPEPGAEPRRRLSPRSSLLSSGGAKMAQMPDDAESVRALQTERARVGIAVDGVPTCPCDRGSVHLQPHLAPEP